MTNRTNLDGKARALTEVCEAVADRRIADAALILRSQYPYAPDPITKRNYGPMQATQVFVRDGFIDRYSGARLVFPPVLRVLSVVMPDDFPYHPNWKTDVTHPAYWEIGATIDHLVPVTRGGSDSEVNWVTTSMALNSAKMNWTLEELGWRLHLPGSYADWDGLMGWFLRYAALVPSVLSNSSVRQWHRAALASVEGLQRKGPSPADPAEG